MSTVQDWEAKAAALFAKAERTSPEEAEALTAAAERIMMKYGIDQAIIDARRGAKIEEPVITEFIDIAGIYFQSLHNMAHNVARGLGNVKVYGHGKGSYAKVAVMGFTSDVHQFKMLFTSLQLQMQVALRAWVKSQEAWSWNSLTAMEKAKARRGFIVGFGDGVRVRLERARQAIVEEGEPGTALVLVDRMAKVNAAYDGLSLSKGRSFALNWGGHAGGKTAGLNSNTGGSQLGGGRRELN